MGLHLVLVKNLIGPLYKASLCILETITGIWGASLFIQGNRFSKVNESVLLLAHTALDTQLRLGPLPAELGLLLHNLTRGFYKLQVPLLTHKGCKIMRQTRFSELDRQALKLFFGVDEL